MPLEIADSEAPVSIDPVKGALKGGAEVCEEGRLLAVEGGFACGRLEVVTGWKEGCCLA